MRFIVCFGEECGAREETEGALMNPLKIEQNPTRNTQKNGQTGIGNDAFFDTLDAMGKGPAAVGVFCTSVAQSRICGSRKNVGFGAAGGDAVLCPPP